MEYTDIITQLRRVVRSVNLESKRIEKYYGVSIPQLLCLQYLQNLPDHTSSQKGIAEYLSLNASTVSGIILRLEKKGLVAKLPKREDRRISYITLTARGAEMISRSPELLHERFSRRLQQLPSDHLSRISEVLTQLTELLGLPSEEDEPPSPILKP
jgi:DNA-binding MarR family transcriptional regulator